MLGFYFLKVGGTNSLDAVFEDISVLDGIEEAHIISGDEDILIKAREDGVVEEFGRINNLRLSSVGFVKER